ncbi:3-hydroxyacyl-CoA dehydrogenase NAD-binding domain-containing protein [Auraticoccus monumenti]|uniref:3-hydroxyacyl-CoA dehydrogenase n=1 Tax=Auraticoccus monumenti TaxID=675864 RepID=A0A1G7C747_9ACTN|nr:3-hydroxyacyl-CoA dehydrogenase NAD-binding domain-containing protein [Auraticoccus monumenti]SDE35129.1 3-hydroxyacyl-CoA dehydrogenase [Auraticoccus monumenti]
MTTYLPDADLERLIAEASALTADDEVVTSALSRDVALPHGAGTAVLITLDNGLDHTRPNTLGPQSMGRLNAAVDAALARADVAAVAITGKPFILAAGADLSGVAKLTSPEQATAIARIGHGVYAKLADATIPTFCFVNGLALGGGLEIALGCHYRTVSASAPAVALPEVFLGLVPGWGGAYLLPNLIGPDNAIKVIIENSMNQNRMLQGHQLQGLGIADATFEAADFLERSLDWAARVVTGEVVVERPEPDRGAGWDAAVARGRAVADAKVHGTAPAPYMALDLVDAARSRTRDEAFAAEDEALTELIMSDELRASLYAFELVQKRAKRPAGAPDKGLARPVTSVGVVGAGLMASQLALLFVRRLEVPVTMSDLDAERAAKGVGYVHAELDKLHAKGRLSADRLNRYKALVSGTTDQADFADCSFVIEAVFEEIGVKKQVFAELEKHVSPETVLATNTSSLSVGEMAADLQHPERVVGFHFFNPVAVLPLLEVVRGERTDDASLATAFSVSKELKKNAVLVRDTRGFVVNRVLLRMMGEITRAMEEGTPPQVADAAVAPLGLPMSPFVLLQLVGPGVALHVAEVLNAEFGERFHVSQSMRNLVEAGKPGVYDWGSDGQPYVSEETAALLVGGDSASTAEEVRQRVEEALAEEIGLMLAEGVVAAPMDIDLCLLLGAGWPFHDGGITPYLDRTGVSERVNGRRFLPPGVASVPRA